MSGEKDLQVLLNEMSAHLHEDVFVFCTLPDRKIPGGLTPLMTFQEKQGTTLIVKETDAVAGDLSFEFRSRMITLEIHSSLEAVGFIAKISTALADKGMGVNPVAGFFHDHLFVPVGREQDALEAIESLRNSTE